MLPKWMRQAIQDQVMSEAEAREMHSLMLAANQEEVPLPVELHPAAQRIHLWEMPTSATLH